MKKILLVLGLGLGFLTLSCTDNSISRNWGGKSTVELERGDRLVNLGWKGEQLWILTKSDSLVTPTSYKFKEKSSFGVMEGEVQIVEK